MLIWGEFVSADQQTDSKHSVTVGPGITDYTDPVSQLRTPFTLMVYILLSGIRIFVLLLSV